MSSRIERRFAAHPRRPHPLLPPAISTARSLRRKEICINNYRRARLPKLCGVVCMRASSVSLHTCVLPGASSCFFDPFFNPFFDAAPTAMPVAVSVDFFVRPDPTLRFFLSLAPFGLPLPFFRFTLSFEPFGRPRPRFPTTAFPTATASDMLCFCVWVWLSGAARPHGEMRERERERERASGEEPKRGECRRERERQRECGGGVLQT